MAENTQAQSTQTVSRRNEKIGNVVSTKMSKTIVVEVVMRKAHPKYGRIVRHSKKFYAHDEQNSCHVGDVVRIRETRPLSKLKRWELVEVLRKEVLAETQTGTTTEVAAQ
jgi:small subunit ribosomal protein S17